MNRIINGIEIPIKDILYIRGITILLEGKPIYSINRFLQDGTIQYSICYMKDRKCESIMVSNSFSTKEEIIRYKNKMILDICHILKDMDIHYGIRSYVTTKDFSMIYSINFITGIQYPHRKPTSSTIDFSFITLIPTSNDDDSLSQFFAKDGELIPGKFLSPIEETPIYTEAMIFYYEAVRTINEFKNKIKPQNNKFDIYYIRTYSFTTSYNFITEKEYFKDDDDDDYIQMPEYYNYYGTFE